MSRRTNGQRLWIGDRRLVEISPPMHMGPVPQGLFLISRFLPYSFPALTYGEHLLSR
jgi:hypothetical protein